MATDVIYIMTGLCLLSLQGGLLLIELTRIRRLLEKQTTDKKKAGER